MVAYPPPYILLEVGETAETATAIVSAATEPVLANP